MCDTTEQLCSRLTDCTVNTSGSAVPDTVILAGHSSLLDLKLHKTASMSYSTSINWAKIFHMPYLHIAFLSTIQYIKMAITRTFDSNRPAKGVLWLVMPKLQNILDPVLTLCCYCWLVQSDIVVLSLLWTNWLVLTGLVVHFTEELSAVISALDILNLCYSFKLMLFCVCVFKWFGLLVLLIHCVIVRGIICCDFSSRHFEM